MKFGEIKLGGRFGGYTIINESADRLPQDLASAVVSVCEDKEYMLVPIWYWGTQLVNGLNHMLVCEKVQNSKYQIVVAIINIPPNSVGGKGAKLVALLDKADLYGALKTAFEGHLKNLCGVGYHPVAYMGEKMVKGVNHYILCEANLQYPGSRPYAAVVEINIFGSDANVTGIERLGGLG